MVKLSVNLNKVALLRNQRDIGIPSVIESAKTVIKAGTNGVTVHPRPDERHIRYSDAYEIRDLLKEYPSVEFNIEGNPFAGRLMELLREIKPDQATLVPDTPGQSTSDHGWDLKTDGRRVKPIVEQLRKLGIRVSLFMDAEPERIGDAAEVGADRVELYTEPYARAFREQEDVDAVLSRYVDSAKAATDAGLAVNAGHDLNLRNLGKFAGQVGGLLEVSIGHALIADALEMGLYKAVKRYLTVLTEC